VTFFIYNKVLVLLFQRDVASEGLLGSQRDSTTQPVVAGVGEESTNAADPMQVLLYVPYCLRC